MENEGSFFHWTAGAAAALCVCGGLFILLLDTMNHAFHKADSMQ